jgi:hypothetical protein
LDFFLCDGAVFIVQRNARISKPIILIDGPDPEAIGMEHESTRLEAQGGLANSPGVKFVRVQLQASCRPELDP